MLFLVLAATLAVTGIALITADDADALPKDLRLTFLDDTNLREAQGLNPNTFNYTIKHTGEVLSEEVVVEIQNEPEAWQHFLSASTKMGVRTSTNVLELMLQRGEVSNMSVTITPPLNQLNQTFWFRVNAYIKKEPGINRSHEIGIVIPQEAGFEIKPWNVPAKGYYEALPPGQVTIRFALFNNGNGVDKFLIQGESSRDTAGWTITFVSGIDEFGFTQELTPDPTKKNPYFIDARIPIPAEEKADVSCQVTVNATSLFDPFEQRPPAYVTIKSLQYYDFQVYILDDEDKEGAPGEQTEFSIKIHNKGNGWDEFLVEPVWDEELNPDFIASANPRTVNIASNESGDVTYIVKVPESAPKKVYFFTAEISSSNKHLAIVTKSFSVEVVQYFKVVLDSKKPHLSTIPGGVLDYEVMVRNGGNGLDSIKIQLLGVPSGWLTYIQPQEVSLLQNEEAKVDIRVIVPIRFEEAPIGSYNITVEADSARSETAVDYFILRLDITQFYRIEWMYQDLPITDEDAPEAQPGIIKPRRSFNPYEKHYIDITLEIKNFGNGEDNIEVSGYGEDPRVQVTVQPVNTLLLRDQTKLIKVHIEVPQDLEPGIYHLYVNGSSEDKTTAIRVVPLDFEIFNYDVKVPETPIYMDPKTGDVVRSELRVETKANLSFKLRVENSGTKPIQTAIVKVYDNYLDDEGELVRWNFFNASTPPIAVGDKYIVGEKPYSRANPPLYWWANVSGDHTLEFRVFYDYQSTTANDVSNINVTVEKQKEESDILTKNPVFLSVVIAIVVAAVVAGGYVVVLRREPRVDADLYSSIYGADFTEEEVMPEAMEEEVAEEGPSLSPEQMALYGEDYGTIEVADEEPPPEE